MVATGSVLDKSKPIQKYFEEISQIPRETENEQLISDYIVGFAQERGLQWRRDELLNVLVRKPASAGYEHARPIILQAHLDMVCAKTDASTHDFAADPIELVLTGSRLSARETSLGADDGFGVAYILAILDDDAISHPELECIFTTQEEHKSMVGAEHFDVSDLKSRRMIGLDGDGEVNTFIGSACSSLVEFEKDIAPVGFQGSVCAFRICKVTGSVIRGVMSQECGNAVKMAVRLLATLREAAMPFQLCSIDGGVGENRSPVSCEVVLACEPSQKEEAQRIIETEFKRMMNEYDSNVYTAQLQFHEQQDVSHMLTKEDSDSIISVLYLMPNNLYRGTADSGEFESLSNLGIVATGARSFSGEISIRSVRQSMEDDLIRGMRLICETFGVKIMTSARYHSWEYNTSSPLRELVNETYNEVLGQSLVEQICPGGLEISWFYDKIKDFDAIMLGPIHENVHTVDEYMDMDSFARVYKILLRILEKMVV